jgi:hypothetical protein
MRLTAAQAKETRRSNHTDDMEGNAPRVVLHENLVPSHGAGNRSNAHPDAWEENVARVVRAMARYGR